jgi:hypothetical protein
MQKQFTIKIPDELYVNSWEEDLSATFNYNGPDTIYVVVSLIKQDDNEDVEEVFNFAFFEPVENPIFQDTEKYKILEISAEQNTALAELLVQKNNPNYEYTYADEENFDGSICAVITNPRITDYYLLDYSLNNENTAYEFKLVPNYKYPQELSILREVEDKITLLEYNRDNVQHSAQNLTKITQAIDTLNNFKVSIKDQRPWKFDKLPDSSAVPQISKAVEMSLKSIPVSEQQAQPEEVAE